jgi:hypothetical protein
VAVGFLVVSHRDLDPPPISVDQKAWGFVEITPSYLGSFICRRGIHDSTAAATLDLLIPVGLLRNAILPPDGKVGSKEFAPEMMAAWLASSARMGICGEHVIQKDVPTDFPDWIP